MSTRKTKQNHQEVLEEHHGSDQYYSTPVSMILAQLGKAARQIRTDQPKILDVGAGNLGGYGWVARLLWPEAYIAGIEIRDTPHYDWYDMMHYGDATEYDFSHIKFDLITGNPAFRLAEAKVRHLLPSLDYYGMISFLIRTNFAESSGRARGLFQEHPPRMIRFSDRRPTWWMYETSNVGKHSTNEVAYSIFEWASFFTGLGYHDWLCWDYNYKLEERFVLELEAAGKKLDPKALEEIRKKLARQEKRNGKSKL